MNKKQPKQTSYHAEAKQGTWTEIELNKIIAERKTDRKTEKIDPETKKPLTIEVQLQHGDRLTEGAGFRGTYRINSKNQAAIAWELRFKWEGKAKTYACGIFPHKKMADIRADRDKARALLSQGINPIDARKAAKIEAQKAIEQTIAQAAKERAENASISNLYNDWITQGVARKDGNQELRRGFESDVLPLIGKLKVKEITEKDLIDFFLTIKKCGVKDAPQRNMNRTIEVRFNNLKQMFKWGATRKQWRLLLAENGNPCSGIKLENIPNLIDFDYKDVRDRVLSDHEIRELNRIFIQQEEDYNQAPAGEKYSCPQPLSVEFKAAIWLCLSTLCRIGELLMSEWEHVDFVQGTWFIPAENTKAKRNQAQDQTVYLSKFALEEFKKLYNKTGSSRWCFPSRNNKQNHVCVKSISKQVGDRQVQFKNRPKPLVGRRNDNSLVLAGGSKGAWTPHDLRRTGAVLMQRLGVGLDIIDRCQNHVLAGSKVRRHYLQYDYNKEKAEAWHLLGQHLDQLLNFDNLITFTGQKQA